MTTPARTVFLGTGDFAVPIVDALAGHPWVDLAAVVTAPARRGSRGRIAQPPVAEWALRRSIPMFRPARLRDVEAVDQIAALEPSLLVLADYGQIVPQALLDLPIHGALNVHPSLLPRHRGATPIASAILAGDEETGVTLMLMDAGIDSGPIVSQARIALRGDEIAPELEIRLATRAAELLRDELQSWLAGEVQAQAQANEGVTTTRPLRREDGRIDTSRSAAYLERQVRAYQPWPGTFFDTSEGRIVIWKAGVVADGGGPGTIFAGDSGTPAIATSDGSLELVEVQPAGGRRMAGAELIRGRPGLVGSVVIGPS